MENHATEHRRAGHRRHNPAGMPPPPGTQGAKRQHQSIRAHEPQGYQEHPVIPAGQAVARPPASAAVRIVRRPEG